MRNDEIWVEELYCWNEYCGRHVSPMREEQALSEVTTQRRRVP